MAEIDDVRIADFDNEEPEESEDTESVVAALYRQKQNGNLDKARELGDKLAFELADGGKASLFDVSDSETGASVYHRRLLFLFAVTQGIETFCPNSIVGKTAENRFFESIKKNSPEYYKTLKETLDYSYYLLCERDSDDVEDCIGRAFASLIGKENDEEAAKLGRDLYLSFYDIVKGYILDSGFKE